MYALGLMSGTSADGIDAALVHFRGNPAKPRWKILNVASIEYPEDLKKAIINCGQGEKFSSQDLSDLTETITELHLLAAKKCDPTGIAAIIGCHGQTVFHRPPNASRRGTSLQLLQGSLLATLLNKAVVFDFRAKDMALGGQGAPLVPLLDDALIGRCQGWRGILNLGGIANLSLLPPHCGPEQGFPVLGWDCGPANSLIDLFIKQRTNGELNFDRYGLIAQTGSPDFDIVKKWLQEPFFQLPPPKSTGRELFGEQDLKRRLDEINRSSMQDILATLTIFSACAVAQDVKNIYHTHLIRPIELLISGGGSKNHFFFNQIVDRCSGIRVFKTEDIGLPVQAREALAFALLAWWNILQKTGSSPASTGISRPAVLGTKVTPR